MAKKNAKRNGNIASKSGPETPRLSLLDLLAAAKTHWNEGSLYDEAVAAEQAGTLQPHGRDSIVNDVPILLRTPGLLPAERRYERRHVDMWDYGSDHSDAIEDAEYGTDASVTLCDVVTTDAGTVRVAIYEDDYKGSIDRVPDETTLPEACRMWRERWGGDVPGWVSDVAKWDERSDELLVQVSATFDESGRRAVGSVRAGGRLSREECQKVCRSLLESLYEKHGHALDEGDDADGRG